MLYLILAMSGIPLFIIIDYFFITSTKFIGTEQYIMDNGIKGERNTYKTKRAMVSRYTWIPVSKYFTKGSAWVLLYLVIGIAIILLLLALIGNKDKSKIGVVKSLLK